MHINLLYQFLVARGAFAITYTYVHLMLWMAGVIGTQAKGIQGVLGGSKFLRLNFGCESTGNWDTTSYIGSIRRPTVEAPLATRN